MHANCTPVTGRADEPRGKLEYGQLVFELLERHRFRSGARFERPETMYLIVAYVPKKCSHKNSSPNVAMRTLLARKPLKHGRRLR